MNQSKVIIDGALLTAVYVVMLLIILFIPVIQLFGIFVLPVPFVIYAARYGYKAGLFMFAGTVILSFIIATVFSLPLTLLVGMGGIVIGGSLYQKKSAYEVWAQGTVGFIIGFIAVFALLQLVFAINLYDEVDFIIQESMQLMESIVMQLDIGNELSGPMAIMEERLLHFKDLIPSFIAITSIFFAFLTQWISFKVINRLDRKQYHFPAFKDLNFPTFIIWVYFVALILSLMNIDTDSIFYLILVNASALAVVMIVIQGFSFIFHYMHHKNIHKSVPVIIVIVTLLVPFLFMFIVRIIGIIDLGFSLKKRITGQK